MMARLVEEKPLRVEDVKLIAGVDVAYREGSAVAAAVLASLPDLSIVEESILRSEVKVPYIPGLLGFREAPIMSGAVKRLENTPDVVMVDAHGLAHPRMFGSACHVGIILNLPTIGVAKSPLRGKQLANININRSCRHRSRIKDPRGKPYYVSVGHRAMLQDSLALVEMCMGRYGPEPLRRAHLRAVEACRNP